MATVKINHQEVEINRIISFGCSFTAGAELLDHTIHPDADLIKREKGSTYWKENYETPETIKLSGQEQMLSWAGQTAKKLNVDFYGRARGGSSLPWSLIQLEEAIRKNELTDDTLILFGVTTMTRAIHFQETPSGAIKNFIFGHPWWWPNKEWDKETVLDIYNNSMALWLHMGYILRLIELSNQHKNKIQIFNMWKIVDFNVLNELKRNNVSYYDNFISRIEEIKKATCLHDDVSLINLCVNKNDQHGGNHPKIHIHDKFSDYVLERLGKKQDV